MAGDELRKILCLMEPGMTLTVSDDWVAKRIGGTLQARLRLIDDLARQYGCHCAHGIDSQTFEKLDIPATG